MAVSRYRRNYVRKSKSGMWNRTYSISSIMWKTISGGPRGHSTSTSNFFTYTTTGRYSWGMSFLRSGDNAL